MNPALRLGIGLLTFGLVGLALGCSTATQEIPRTARLEFAKNGQPYRAALHEYYAWRPTAETLLAPHQLTLVDTNDAWYVVTIDVRHLPFASDPALSVANIRVNSTRPRHLPAASAYKEKEEAPRFSSPTHPSFQLAEAMERSAQSNANSSSH